MIDQPPPVPPASHSPAAPPKTSGMAIASLVLGVVSVAGAAILIIPTILAIVLGHVSLSRIRRDPTLAGSGMAIAGLVLGYVSIVFGIVIAGLLAAMAIPAFEKVREQSLQKTMINDARQISAAAQQVMLEKGTERVSFEIDPATGAVSGDLAEYVKQLTKGTRQIDGVIDGLDDTFSLQNPRAYQGREVVFNADGTQQQ